MVATGFGDETLHVFIIETDSYAGNFERELCAYATGMIGECGVGKKLAERFEEEVSDKDKDNPFFDGIVISWPDDHACLRPCSIWEGNMCDDENYNAVAIFFDGHPNEDVHTEGDCRYGTDLIGLMKSRCLDYAKNRTDVLNEPSPFNILGFRLIKMQRKWIKEEIEI